jgi:hypothetical protein
LQRFESFSAYFTSTSYQGKGSQNKNIKEETGEFWQNVACSKTSAI